MIVSTTSAGRFWLSLRLATTRVSREPEADGAALERSA